MRLHFCCLTLTCCVTLFDGHLTIDCIVRAERGLTLMMVMKRRRIIMHVMLLMIMVMIIWMMSRMMMMNIRMIMMTR